MEQKGYVLYECLERNQKKGRQQIQTLEIAICKIPKVKGNRT